MIAYLSGCRLEYVCAGNETKSENEHQETAEQEGNNKGVMPSPTLVFVEWHRIFWKSEYNET
jgi:hypothetical protein